MSDPEHYDPKVFIEMAAGSDEVAKKIAIMYHEDIQADLDAIDSAFLEGNLDEVRRLTHKSRSAYGIMGAKAISELAAIIETQSALGNDKISEEIRLLRALSLQLDHELVRDFKIQ